MIGFSVTDLAIGIKDYEIQNLATKYFGIKLTEKEMDAFKTMFDIRIDQVDDGGWEGILAHFIQVVISAIGLVIEDHRHLRSK